LASVDSAALPVWSLVFDSTFRGKPCEALGLQQMGGGDEMSWQSKRLFYNGKKYDYDIYIIIYIYACIMYMYTLIRIITLYRYVKATLVFLGEKVHYMV